MTARTYRKAGETVRAEKSRAGLIFLSTSEHGFAEEDGGRFVCHPTGTSASLRAPDRDEVQELVRRLESATGSVEVERMTVLSGRAAHHFRAGAIEREWNESFARLHLAILDPSARLRITIDLGGPALDEIDLALVEEVVAAAGQLISFESTDTAVLLRPHVAAALWPALALGAGPETRPDAALCIEQTTHPKFRFDGDGLEIEPRICIDFALRRPAAPRWSNRYRPSYRTRPVPMPFHVRARAGGLRSGAEIEAVGLIEGFQVAGGRIAASLLCRRIGSAQAFPAHFSLPLEEFIRRIRFVDEQRRWFPYAAGSYGGGVELERLPLRAGRG